MSWIDNNIILTINKNINLIMDYVYKDNISFNDLMKGGYYKCLHAIYIYLLMFVILFNNNIYHLLVLLCIIMLNAFAVTVRNRCPLSEFEEKYTKESAYLTRQNILKSIINYSCTHEYESTIEMLLNTWCMLSFKCIIIIILKMFNIQLNNFNNIYQV